MPATLKVFRFTLVLSGFVSELMDDIANALYEAGCDDAGVGSCNGVVTVEFDRKAESKGNAIGSAVVQVDRTRFHLPFTLTLESVRRA